MNYLAHAVLSFNDKNILTGNLISDFVKGRQILNFSNEIVAGIKLHRAIDAYTDQHEVVKETKKIFKESYGLYAGAFLDVAFDYFVANDAHFFKNDAELKQFAANAYRSVEKNYPLLTDNITSMLINMKKYDWLYNYKTIYGIEKSFSGLVYKTKYIDNAADAVAIFHKYFNEIEQAYNAFMPDLHTYSETFMTRAMSQEALPLP
ncbi:acyl carrier protein phosphodiesterase [Polluticaenibacter yanchengensis]|uniref:ACP phosphodiesterase n=1 Tax=Polluticaenibacter yanchengensis TaxID=3014562 RepID=A0ABT4UFC7_9BACT|nr:ACP phosphodiesterase [Chitinophagaceae bacterium LY-5]